MKRFRQTPMTNTALEPSMSHAVVRAHLETGQGESLLLILKNKLQYGIFPDNYAIILMLDHFMTNKNYRYQHLGGFLCHHVSYSSEP